MLAWVAHIGIDEQSSLAHLSEHRREIGRKPAAAFSPAGARYCKYFVLTRPTKAQLTAQCAQWFDQFALRQVSRNDIVRNAAIAASRNRRIVELLRNRQIDVVLGQQFQLYGRIAESKTVRGGEALDFVEVVRIQTPLLDENSSYGPSSVAGRLGDLFEGTSDFGHIHGTSLAARRSGVIWAQGGGPCVLDRAVPASRNQVFPVSARRGAGQDRPRREDVYPSSREEAPRRCQVWRPGTCLLRPKPKISDPKGREAPRRTITGRRWFAAFDFPDCSMRAAESPRRDRAAR